MASSLSVELPSFFAKRNKIQSHICSIVSAHSETPKSFDVTLRPVFGKRSACWRCGKAISNEHSIHWGVGPDCADTIGLPWKELPEDRQDAISEVRVYLPKSFLSEQELILLRSWVNSKTEEKQVHQARVWLTDDKRLMLESPYVNRSFVDDLKLVPGRRWHGDTKTNSFEASPEALSALLGVVSRWQVLVNIDDSLTEMLNAQRAKETVFESTAKNLGVDTIQEIKYAEIDNIEDFDWGLKTTPWLHQAQAILFTATMFGKSVKKK